MSLLNVENLNIYYGNIHAVKGVNLIVNEGEVVCLIGANGAGKTTTLQAISGLLPIKNGSVSFQGRNITKVKSHEITNMGIAQVPEGRRIFANLSVEDNLELGAYHVDGTKEDEEAHMERIYELFPVLKERKKQKAGTLSGGEQQMLSMGRALMTKPRLLLLDEPSMGLSPLFVDKIFETIEILKAEGRTILLVEQNANLALKVSDRGYVLETGKVVKEGLSSELRDDPSVKTAYLGA